MSCSLLGAMYVSVYIHVHTDSHRTRAYVKDELLSQLNSEANTGENMFLSATSHFWHSVQREEINGTQQQKMPTAQVSGHSARLLHSLTAPKLFTTISSKIRPEHFLNSVISVSLSASYPSSFESPEKESSLGMGFLISNWCTFLFSKCAQAYPTSKNIFQFERAESSFQSSKLKLVGLVSLKLEPVKKTHTSLRFELRRMLSDCRWDTVCHMIVGNPLC